MAVPRGTVSLIYPTLFFILYNVSKLNIYVHNTREIVDYDNYEYNNVFS